VLRCRDCGGMRKAIGIRRTNPPRRTRGRMGRGYTRICIARKATCRTRNIGIGERTERRRMVTWRENGQRLWGRCCGPVVSSQPPVTSFPVSFSFCGPSTQVSAQKEGREFPPRRAQGRLLRLGSLRISPAGSRFAHANKAAQVSATRPHDPKIAGSETRSRRSAQMTTITRLDYSSSRLEVMPSNSSSGSLICGRSLMRSCDLSCGSSIFCSSSHCFSRFWVD